MPKDNRDYGKEMQDINAEINVLEDIKRSLVSDKDKIYESGIALKSKIDTTKSLIEKIKAQNGCCAIDKSLKCNQNFSTFIVTAEAENQSDSFEKNKILSNYTSKLNEIKSIDASINVLNNKKNALNLELIEKNKSSIISNEIQALTTQESSLRSQKNDLNYEKTSITFLSVDILNNQRNAITIAIDNLKKNIEDGNNAKNSFNLLQKTLLQREENATDFENVKVLLKNLGVNGLQGIVLKDGLKPLTNKINELLLQLGMEETFYFKSEGRSFDFGLSNGKEEIDFNVLSKGESLIVTLAILTAITEKKNPNFKILIIDEINNLDDEHLIAVVNSLAKLESYFDNILLAGAVREDLIKSVNGFNVISLYPTEKVKIEEPKSMFDMFKNEVI
jgi:hypothetical protein